MYDSTEPWRRTGFAVVLDITIGRAGHVYIVWDYRPEEEETGERKPVQPHVGDGHLPNMPQTLKDFSVAKIAKSLSDLQWNYQLHLENPLQHAPELVYVQQEADGRPLLRATIVRPEHMPRN